MASSTPAQFCMLVALVSVPSLNTRSIVDVSPAASEPRKRAVELERYAAPEGLVGMSPRRALGPRQSPRL